MDPESNSEAKSSAKAMKRLALISRGNALSAAEKRCKSVQARFFEAKRKLYVHAKGSVMAREAAAKYRELRLELAAAKEQWSEAKTEFDRSRDSISDGAKIASKPVDLESYFSSTISGKKPSKRKMKQAPKGQRISLTWGDAGENHVGMEQVGSKQEPGTGFTFGDLQLIQKHLAPGKLQTELVQLDERTGVLVLRKFLDEAQHNKVFDEVNGCKWDTKYWDKRRKKVLNKQARSNLLFVHGTEQPPCYEQGMGTIIDSDGLPCYCEVEERIKHIVKFGLQESKTAWVDLVCEGNNYGDVTKQGIGFHGDTERTRVICLSLGTAPMVLRFLQFKHCRATSEPVDITLEPGDLYIMSENAVGNNWKKRSQTSWRHAAGCNGESKYLKIQKLWLQPPAKKKARCEGGAAKKTKIDE